MAGELTLEDRLKIARKDVNSANTRLYRLESDVFEITDPNVLRQKIREIREDMLMRAEILDVKK